MSAFNRPFKYGERDRREFITYKSEISIICENDANGNPIYIGRAKAGAALDRPVWQISKQTYDATQSLTRKQWPQNELGAASTEYEFIWDDRATLTYS